MRRLRERYLKGCFLIFLLQRWDDRRSKRTYTAARRRERRVASTTFSSPPKSVNRLRPRCPSSPRADSASSIVLRHRARRSVTGKLAVVTPFVTTGAGFLLGLPGLVSCLQRLGDLAPAVEQIAEFGKTLDDIRRVVPALEQLAEFGTVLEAIARVAPALEQLAELRTTLDDLVRVIEPLGGRRSTKADE